MTAKWISLETFTVESAAGGSRLFWNGRQCVKLRVAIKAVDINNRPVAPTQREIDSIKLVNYHGGRAIKYRAPDFFGPVAPQDGWDWSHVKAGDFDYFPTAPGRMVDEKGEQRSGNTHYKDFYVRTVSQEPLTISLTMERDDGVGFDSRKHEPGNITLTPQRPPAYIPANYRFERVHTTSTDGGTLDYFPFVLVDSGVNIEFREFRVSGTGVSQRVGLDGMITGYTPPGSVTISYRSGGGYDYGPKKINGITPPPGQPGVVSFRKHRLFPHAIPSETVHAIDMYGNDHKVKVSIVDMNAVDGRLKLDFA